MGGAEEGPVFSAELREQLLQLRMELDKEQSTVGDLRRRVATIEKEKLAIVSKCNADAVRLQNESAKMSAELEDCQASRCGLEYELAATKQQLLKDKSVAKEKEQLHLGEETNLKSQISDLRLRLAKAEDDRDKAVATAERKEVALSDAVLVKQAEIESASKELELTRLAKSELEKLSETREKQIAELERKLSQAEAEIQRLADKGKLQRTESDWMLQKEKQIKQELEAAIEKSKCLESNVESERAAHLETKFNSEIVQLRVRDLEAALEEEKGASVAKDAVTVNLKAELEALTKQLQEEKKMVAKTNHKWQKATDELSDSRKHVAQQESLINELSKEIDAHQNHFAVLKEELEKTKVNQKHLEGNYSSWLKDLEITVFNYWFTLKGKRFCEDFPPSSDVSHPSSTASKPSSNSSPTPKSLVEGVKVLLGELAVVLRDSASSEDALRQKEAKITELQQTLGRREHEVDEVKKHLKDVEAEAVVLRSECGRQSDALATESTERRTLESEFGRVAEASRKAEDEKLHFLAETAAKLAALVPNAPTLAEQLETMRAQGGGDGTATGCRSGSAMGSAFGTWSQLSTLTTENAAKVGVVIKALRKKIKGLEEELAREEELKIHLTANQEEALQKMAEASANVELRAAEEKKELEEHFSQLLQKVHDRAKTSDSESQAAFAKIQTIESNLRDNGKEIHLLQSQLDQVEKDRSCLLAAVAIVSGVLIPQLSKHAELASQRRLADEISNQSATFRRHACVLVETLAAEFPSTEDEEEEHHHEQQREQQRGGRRRGFSGLLLFRRAAIVVMATNRLTALGHSTNSKKRESLILSEFPRKGKKAALLIGRKEAMPEWTTMTTTTTTKNGKLVKGTEDTSALESRLANWLTSTDLQTGVILALQPLVERIAFTTDSKGRSATSTSSSRTASGLTEIAAFTSVQMMQRVNAHFLNNDDNGLTHETSNPGGNLCWRLGHGLSRALSSVRLRPRLRLASAQEIMSSLQHHLLAITHRLHTAEVDRKELRTLNAELTAKMGDLKGVREMASSLKNQTSHLQRELQGTVKAEQFASVCGELQATLAREQQTQKLLTHQANRIQNLSQESAAAAKRSEQSETAVRQLTAQLAELKKDSRKKDSEAKERKKSWDRLEAERQLLLANVKDAEKALTTVSKDKDQLLAFVRSVETSLHQATKHLKLLSESGHDGGGGGGGADASVLLPLNLAQLISAQNPRLGKNDSKSSTGRRKGETEEEEGEDANSSSSSSELRAARRLVDLFVDVYQAAFVKMSSMRQELLANQQHVKRLKAELSDACARGVVGAEVLMSANAWNDGRTPLGTRFDGGVGHNAGVGRVEGVNGVGGGTSVGQRLRNFEPLDEDSENSLSADLRGGGGGGGDEFSTPLKSKH